MQTTIIIIQILISVILSILILLQSRGTGLGTAFGGGSEQYRSRRGVEKLLHKATIIFILLFLITSITNLLIK